MADMRDEMLYAARTIEQVRNGAIDAQVTNLLDALHGEVVQAGACSTVPKVVKSLVILGEQAVIRRLQPNAGTLLDAEEKLVNDALRPVWTPYRKRRHHYVWQTYLKAWTHVPTGRLWCSRKGGRPFSSGTADIGLENDLYRHHELTDRDVEFLTAFAGPTNQAIRKYTLGWIGYFQDLSEIRRRMVSLRRWDAKVQEFHDILKSNFEEDIQSGVEDYAHDILPELRRGEGAIFGDAAGERHLRWCVFLATQVTRTPRFRETLASTARMCPGVNEAAVIPVMRTMISWNMGYSLHLHRPLLKVEFLQADGAEFITGDQPAFITGAAPRARKAEVGALARGDRAQSPQTQTIYYPLSPTLALLMDFNAGSHSVVHRTASPGEVRNHNHMLARVAHEQVYAASERALVELG